MDGINNEPLYQLGKIDINRISPKKDNKKNEIPHKTGDLAASMEYEGVANRSLVKGKSKETKLKQALHEDLKFLKKNYTGPEINDSVIKQQLEDFHFLVERMPLPSDPEDLGDASLADYSRRQALKHLEQFEIYLNYDPQLPGPEDADEVEKLGGEANWIREKAYQDMMIYRSAPTSIPIDESAPTSIPNNIDLEPHTPIIDDSEIPEIPVPDYTDEEISIDPNIEMSPTSLIEMSPTSLD